MKSKTFCFNSAVFRKNTVLYWPLWAGYFLVLFALVPVRMWMLFNSYLSYYSIGESKRQKDSVLMTYFSGIISKMDLYSLIVLAMAILTMMALFNYLFTSRSTNMMHAFPVTRDELFITSIVNALCFMLIPEMITFFATVLVCLSYGVTCVQYVAVFFLAIATASILFLAISAVAAMLTGQLLGVPAVVAIVNLFYVWIRIVIGKVLCAVGYGLVEYSTRTDHSLLFFSPINYFMRRVKFNPQYQQDSTADYVTGITVEGFSVMGWYLVAAILLFALAAVLYRRRPLEKAGDVMAFSKLNPIFRWLIGIMAGYTLVMCFGMFLENARIYLSHAALACVTILLGLLSFYIAEMLICKNFRIMSRRLLKESVGFACALLASFGGILVVARIQESYIPKAEEVTSIAFMASYDMQLDAGEAEPVIELQKKIVAHAAEWNDASKKAMDCTRIKIYYTLKDGKIVRRNYTIPNTKTGLDMVAQISTYERDPGLFMEQYMRDYYEQQYYVTGGFDVNYTQYVPVEQEKARILLAAIKKDILDGNIQCYNLMQPNGSWETMEDQYSSYLSFDFKNPNPAKIYDEYVDEYITYGDYCSISFGTKSRNLIAALIETGLIRSEDELGFVNDQTTEQ